MTSFSARGMLATGVAVLALVVSQSASARGAGQAANALEASPAAAAQPGAQQSTSSATDAAGADIVVTAQRTSQNVQRVPLAVTAFSGAQLDKLQLRGTDDLKYVTPNLQIERNLSNSSTPTLYIRGIGVSNSAFSFDSPIGIYVDDVYYPRVIGSLVDFIDVDHIEVLRGPQGTIYGRDASIGAIRVISKAPPLQRVDLKADASYGTANEVDTRISVGVPLVPGRIGVRLSAVTKNDDGFETNTFNGEKVQKDDMYALRGAVLVQLGDAASLTFRGDYLHDSSLPTVGSRFLGDPDNDLRTFVSELSYRDGSAVSLVETWGGSMTGKVELGDVTLSSITAYRGIHQREAFDTDGTTSSSFEVRRGDLDEREFTQEVFAAGSKLGALPVDWVAGAFYFHEPNRYVWSLQIFDPPSVQYFHQVEDSVAGYAQGTVHLNERLSITGGGRYTHELKDFSAIGLTGTGDPDFTYDLENSPTSKFTWRAAVNYQADPHLLLYASAATGFRSAALNGNAQSLADVTGGAFGVESTLMYEAGLKSTFLGGRATFNAAAFYGKYTNLQQALTRPDGSVSTSSNDEDVYGAEFEAQLRPVRGLQLFGSLGVLHTHLINAIGAPSEDSPNYNVGGSYTVGTSKGGSLVLASTFHHEPERPSLSLGNQVDAHNNLDASVTYNLPGNHWSLTAGGYNLTNEIYSIGGFDIANGFITAVKFPSLPRRLYVRAAYQF